MFTGHASLWRDSLVATKTPPRGQADAVMETSAKRRQLGVLGARHARENLDARCGRGRHQN
eukprot:8064069-Lingulodinium_polyedra.AAC.1